MSIAGSMAELSPVLLALCGLCVAGAAVGCVLTLIEAALVLGSAAKQREDPAVEPAVTVLKPLHGAEPDLPARLTAFCRQDYAGAVQIVCGAADEASSAAGVRALQAELSDQRLELVIDPRAHGTNRKVSNLINMLTRARYDTLVLSDSDIVVGADYLRAVVALLAAPRVGAVSCLYYGIGDDGLWARLSALAINSHFLPLAIAATRLGLAKPCSGATIALRRSVLNHIGGLGAFADVLADDYAIGAAVRAAGYDVVIAPFVVGHRCFEETARQLVRHEMRVARTIRAIDPIGYAGTILTHPFPLALLGLMSGSTAAAAIAAAVLAARLTLCRCVERRFGLQRQDYWLIPLQDVIAFVVYVASFFGATVHWRGSDYRVAADGSLIGQDLRH